MSLIYHYTSLDALYNIIEGMVLPDDSKDDVILLLRATHYAFLNDSTEGALLPQALEDLGVSRSTIALALLNTGKKYALSFSRKGDDLNMWRAYSKDGTGVSLGFDENLLRREIESQDQNTTCLKKNLEECKYIDTEGLKNIIAKRTEYQQYKANKSLKLITNLFLDMLKYKHSAYAEEQEVRVSFIGALQEKYKLSSNTLVPYQEIKIPLPILKTIRFGPKVDFEKMEYSTRNMLKNKVGENRMNHIELEKSDIPYV